MRGEELVPDIVGWKVSCSFGRCMIVQVFVGGV